MRIEVNISKRHAYLLAAIGALLVITIIAIAQSPRLVDATKPYHSITQVTKGDTLETVDQNANLIIDEADNAASFNGSNPLDYCRVGDTRPGCASGGTATQGAVMGWCMLANSAWLGKPCDAIAPAYCGCFIGTWPFGREIDTSRCGTPENDAPSGLTWNCACPPTYRRVHDRMYGDETQIVMYQSYYCVKE